MPFRQSGPIRFFQFESLAHPSLVHAIFTRRGGTSPPPWKSLNVGGTVGDDWERVRENRRLAFEAVGRNPASMYDVWQVHSAEAIVVRKPRGQEPICRADIMVTDSPRVSLFMRFADCVPVLLFDPGRRVIALAHAGWVGTVRKAVLVAMQTLREVYGTNPGDITAGLGPSIGPDHYPVGQDVLGQVRAAFGSKAEKYLTSIDGQVHFDLWTANYDLLRQAGAESVEVAGLCTACDPAQWFSHRAEHGVTGRFGALLGLAG